MALHVMFSIKRLVLSLLIFLFICALWPCDARYVQPTASLSPRAPPVDTPVTVAPQTAVETGAHETLWVSYGDLTANSVATQTISGTPTVVPLWYCSPSETAAACKGCPSTTTDTAQPACTSGFNGIVLYPIGAVFVGGIVPPPEGLPTLTIGDDGTPATMTGTLVPTTAPATTISELVIEAACQSPSLKAADYASEPLPDIPLPSPKPPPAPIWDAPTAPGLPALGLPVGDPKNPDWGRECGASSIFHNPYKLPRVIYDYPTSFSYRDGYNAIEQFCKENIARKRVIGRDGAHPLGDANKGLSAISFVQRSYDTPNSGKLQIEVQFDKDNKNREGKKCPSDQLWVFPEDDAFGKCRQILAQLVESCDQDPKGDANDVNWKHGGTLYTSCTYWTLIKTPPGEEGDQSPVCSWRDLLLKTCT